MITDQYIKEYLLRNGYSKEQIESPSFNLDSLEDNFAEPLDLSRVENIEDLKIFLMVHLDFIVTQEDIDRGKVYELSKLLVNYALIASEKDLRLDKLFVPQNEIIVFRKDAGFAFAKKKIILKNFALQNIDIEKGVNDYGNIVALGDSMENNRYINQDKEDLALSLDFEDCEGVELEKFSDFSLELSCKDCHEIFCPNGMNLSSLTLDNSICSNLATLSIGDSLTLANIEEIDLSGISSPSISATLSNIGKCRVGGEVHFPSTSFSYVNFEGNNAIFSVESSLDMYSCTFTEAMPIFQANTINIDNCIMPNVVQAFQGERISIKHCDFNVVLATTPRSSLSLSDCYGVDERYDALVSELRERKCGITTQDISGYDVRRTLKDLNLNAEENSDLLDDIVKLRAVLENNNFLQRIQVSPTLTSEQKQLLEELASDKIYYFSIFAGDAYGDFSEDLGENLGYSNNFDMFLAADKAYEEIVDGLNPEWSELQKFKYLYDELGKRISYDTNVLGRYNSDVESFNYANSVARNAFSEILTKNGVCAGFSRAYEYLCKKAGLQCHSVGGKGHSWNVIQYMENGELQSCFCDLTWDALATKVGMRSNYFGFGREDGEHEIDSLDGKKEYVKDVKKLAYEKVVETDVAIGHADYREDTYRQLSDVSEQTVSALLKAMMDVQDLSTLSNKEMSQLAITVLMLNGYDEKNIGYNRAFIRRNALADKEERTFLWVKQKDEQGQESVEYFTFNFQQQEFKLMDRELIEEFLAAGMIEFYEGGRLPGFEHWASDKEYYSRGHGSGSMER